MIQGCNHQKMEDSKTGSRLAVCHLQAMERNKRERPLQGRCSSRNFGSAVSMPSAAQHWLAVRWFLEQSPAKAKHRAMMPWKWHVVGGWSGVSVGGPQGLWLRRTRPVLMVSVDLQQRDAHQLALYRCPLPAGSTAELPLLQGAGWSFATPLGQPAHCVSGVGAT